MPIRVRAADVRNNFSEIIGRAHFGREIFLIEKQGKPYAVVIDIDECRGLLRSSGRDAEATGEPGSS